LKRIFVEREKCLACLTCMVVCVDASHRKAENLDGQRGIDSIEPRNYTTHAKGYSMTLICRHCNDPECVTTRHVIYDKERCGQCFMCVMSCPYGLPRPDIASRTEVIRCHFCIGIAEGPSCAASCPVGTLTVVEVDC
jgi:carbon-monoxide dehydrogenase iron sulfur subunit